MKPIVFALALGIGLTACTDNRAPLSPDFGNAVRTNISRQVVNPEPRTGNADWSSNGERGVSANERYRKGRVYPPIPPYKPVAPAPGMGGMVTPGGTP